MITNISRPQAMFENRHDAGRRLAAELGAYSNQPVVVLAIPNGGVPVALEVAEALKADFDLVICREVLEHLTILQVKRAVSTIAAYTSKYLYLTTRYYPSPKGLLDVTDDIGTDPTHLTLLNKDFLMILFMLEGLKRRPDLEEKMDWKQFGRVLVFERGR